MPVNKNPEFLIRNGRIMNMINDMDNYPKVLPTRPVSTGSLRVPRVLHTRPVSTGSLRVPRVLRTRPVSMGNSGVRSQTPYYSPHSNNIRVGTPYPKKESHQLRSQTPYYNHPSNIRKGTPYPNKESHQLRSQTPYYSQHSNNIITDTPYPKKKSLPVFSSDINKKRTAEDLTINFFKKFINTQGGKYSNNKVVKKSKRVVKKANKKMI